MRNHKQKKHDRSKVWFRLGFSSSLLCLIFCDFPKKKQRTMRRHKRKKIKRQMFCIKYVYQSAYKLTTDSCNAFSRNQYTYSPWCRMVKCSPTFYFVFINLLIYFTQCRFLIFVFFRWTSWIFCLFSFVHAYQCIKVQIIISNDMPLC